MIIDVLNATTRTIMQAQTKAEIREALQAAITSLGFDSFNLSCSKSHKREFMTDPTVSSWSDADLLRYEQDRWAERDPLLTYAASEGPVRSWRMTDWLNAQDGDYARYLAELGLKGGVTAPLTLAPGGLAAITVLSTRMDTFDNEIVQAIPLLGKITLMRMETLGLASSDATMPKSALKLLSDHQMEILRWAAKGKSNGDIAEIVGCKKRSVEYHMMQILKKLDVSTKLQASMIYMSYV